MNNNSNKEVDNITIRHDIKAGDVGYLIYLHGKIYKEEYNYTLAFEGYVAQTFYEFLKLKTFVIPA